MVELPKVGVGEIAVGVGGAAVVGALVGAAVIARRRKKRRAKKRKNSFSRKRNRKARKGRRSPRTAGKGRDTSRRRIRYTKKGQPYVIMGNGRARFIKKKGARRSHKQKGGRY